MANLRRFIRILLSFGNRKPKTTILKTGIKTVITPSTERIRRIEVYDVKQVDPLGITLKLLEDN